VRNYVENPEALPARVFRKSKPARDHDWKIGSGMHLLREAEREYLGSYVKVESEWVARYSLKGYDGLTASYPGVSNLIFDQLPFTRRSRPGRIALVKKGERPQLARTREGMRRQKKGDTINASRYLRESFFNDGGVAFRLNPVLDAQMNLRFMEEDAMSSKPDDMIYRNEHGVPWVPERLDYQKTRKYQKYVRVLRKFRRNVTIAVEQDLNESIELSPVLCALEVGNDIQEETKKLASLAAGQSSSLSHPLTRGYEELNQKHRYMAIIGKIQAKLPHLDEETQSWFGETSLLVEKHGEKAVFAPGNVYGNDFKKFSMWSRLMRGYRVEVATDSPDKLVDTAHNSTRLGQVVRIYSDHPVLSQKSYQYLRRDYWMNWRRNAGVPDQEGNVLLSNDDYQSYRPKAPKKEQVSPYEYLFDL